MTNKITELNAKEINTISGGLVAEMVVVGASCFGFSILKTWQNGACVKWEDNKWSSQARCYLTNASEDLTFFGVYLTWLGYKFHQTPKAHSA